MRKNVLATAAAVCVIALGACAEKNTPSTDTTEAVVLTEEKTSTEPLDKVQIQRLEDVSAKINAAEDPVAAEVVFTENAAETKPNLLAAIRDVYIAKMASLAPGIPKLIEEADSMEEAKKIRSAAADGLSGEGLSPINSVYEEKLCAKARKIGDPGERIATLNKYVIGQAGRGCVITGN